MAQSLVPTASDPAILDVREQQASESISTAIAALRTQILSGLFKPPHQRNLPTLLLYDERGLRLYDDLTTHALEYYLFAAEEQILADHAKEMVEFMGVQGNENAVVVELGAGSLRKTSHILLALADTVAEPTAATEAPITYYALDLERRELLRTLGVVSSTIGPKLAGRVATKGMWGTYDGGLAFIRTGGLLKGATPDDDDDGGITQRCGDLNLKEPHPVFTTTSSQAPTPRPSSPAVEEDDAKSASDHQSGSYDHEASTNMSTHTPPTSHPAEEEIRITISRPASPSPFDEAQAEHPPLHLLFLGSSLGNFPRPDAVDFLKSLPLRPGSGDTLLLGLDHRNDGKTIELAYNDPAGWTAKFELNGLRVAERVLQGRGDQVDLDYGEIFKKDGWKFEGKWNEVEGRHESYFRSTRKQVVVVPPDIDRPQDPETPVHFEEGELVRIEYSYKYSDAEALALFSAANLRVINRWKDNKGMYSMWLLERPPFTFPRTRSPSTTPATSIISPSQPLTHLTSFPPVPTLAEWSTLWSLWDLITLDMIPPSMLHSKPIDLRHKCLFYLGHIPTFLDIHLTRVLRRMGKSSEGHTEPEYFKDIFERGIDPHVDDPSVIHPHSEVPDKDEDWPALDQVLAFRDRVRARLIRVYEEYGVERKGAESTVRDFPRSLARVLWMTWEHEAFHAETLLYMLIQKAGDVDGTLPPPGFAKPQWETLKKLPTWSQPLPTTTVTLEAGVEVLLGHDDIEAEDSFDQVNSPTHEFGWDNESPKRSAKLGEKAIKVETRPILNGEFYDFWIKERKDGGHDLPGLWALDSEGNVQVRTVYGPVSISVAANWPFVGAYDDLQAFAKWKGGRLPNEVELRTYMDRYEGAEESNIGFKNWHPIPPQLPDVENGGRGHNGGVWEWASSLFDDYRGFEKSVLYPGYSSDFFDGKHQVVLGGSYATVPRLAQRRSLRNWYQHNYPYAWIGGRVVYDI